MTPEQRIAWAAHLDALGFRFAAHAIRNGYDKVDTRAASCGCEIAVLAPCAEHREKVPA